MWYFNRSISARSCSNNTGMINVSDAGSELQPVGLQQKIFSLLFSLLNVSKHRVQQSNQNPNEESHPRKLPVFTE